MEVRRLIERRFGRVTPVPINRRGGFRVEVGSTVIQSLLISIDNSAWWSNEYEKQNYLNFVYFSWDSWTGSKFIDVYQYTKLRLGIESHLRTSKYKRSSRGDEVLDWWQIRCAIAHEKFDRTTEVMAFLSTSLSHHGELAKRTIITNDFPIIRNDERKYCNNLFRILQMSRSHSLSENRKKSRLTQMAKNYYESFSTS